MINVSKETVIHIKVDKYMNMPCQKNSVYTYKNLVKRSTDSPAHLRYDKCIKGTVLHVKVERYVNVQIHVCAIMSRVKGAWGGDLGFWGVNILQRVDWLLLTYTHTHTHTHAHTQTHTHSRTHTHKYYLSTS